MSTSYNPVFLRTPKRLINGKWAWLERVQQIQHGGLKTYRRYTV